MTEIAKSREYIKVYLKTGNSDDMQSAIKNNIFYKLFCNDYVLTQDSISLDDGIKIYNGVCDILSYDGSVDVKILQDILSDFTTLENLYYDLTIMCEKVKDMKEYLKTFLAYNLDFSGSSLRGLMNLEQAENKLNGYSLDKEDLLFITLDTWLQESIFYDHSIVYGLKEYIRLSNFLTALYKTLISKIDRY